MDESQFTEAAERSTVFGRVTPEQKQRLVEALRGNGHYVAMTGDGVNDVLSLKQANLGIAMQSGSQATRDAADIVLLRDSFGALPNAFREGQRIRRGLCRILELFLTRVFTVALIILAVLVVEAGFPFSPAQITLVDLAHCWHPHLRHRPLDAARTATPQPTAPPAAIRAAGIDASGVRRVCCLHRGLHPI